MNSRAGYYKTNLSGETAYKSFVPAPLPPDPPIELTEDLVELLVNAHCALAVLESMTVRIPGAGLFKNMFMLKEALNLAFNTVSAAVTRLTDTGILVKTSDNSRNRTFAYKEYLDILRSGT